MIEVKCSCGKYEATFKDDDDSLAETAAEMHVILGPGHTVVGKKKFQGSVKQLFVISSHKPKEK